LACITFDNHGLRHDRIAAADEGDGQVLGVRQGIHDASSNFRLRTFWLGVWAAVNGMIFLADFHRYIGRRLFLVRLHVSHLRPFEQKVIRLLAGPVLERAEVEAVMREAALVSHEYSGVGYFLTVTYASLSKERVVKSSFFCLSASYIVKL
jgi:hypothetical protein